MKQLPVDVFGKAENTAYVASLGRHPTGKTTPDTRCYSCPYRALYGALNDYAEANDLPTVNVTAADIEANKDVGIDEAIPDDSIHLHCFIKPLRKGTSTGLVGEELIMRKVVVIPSWKQFFKLP